jgi:diguanylate cyclase (GGDEF)-like protein
MRLRHKFALNGLIPLLLSFCMISVIVLFMMQLQTSAKEDVRLLVTSEQLRGSLVSLQQSVVAFAQAPTTLNLNEAQKDMKDTDRLISLLHPYLTRSDKIRYGDQILNNYAELYQTLDSILKNGEPVEVKLHATSILRILDDIQELKDSLSDRYAQKNARLQRQLELIIAFSALGSVAMILFSTGMSVRIYRSISGSIRELQQVIKQVEHGNLAAQANIGSRDELGELTQSFNTMIRERRTAEDKIAYMAYRDELTGLSNRRDLHVKLVEAMNTAGSEGLGVGLLFFDLDYFKKINDSLGHSSGDLILKLIADRLSARLNGRALLARMGGDEFIALVPRAENRSQITETAKLILEELKDPIRLQGIDFAISASIGASYYPCDGEDSDTLIKNADIALYHVKETGRGGFQFFSREMPEESVEQLILAGELHLALEQGQLAVHYQPQMEVNTGRISGFEALVRWFHPVKGLILPGKFIPLAEQSELINRIGEFVLLTACRQMKTWLDAGMVRDARMSVNLSSRQFIHHNPAELIGSILAETGLDPSYLEIEITESMTMNVERAVSVLNDLKRLGIRIAIDDFGTGYSSLHYLKSFPIDRLKIDRSFVRDITEDANDRAIVTTIISMAKNLELSVTAEGVESTDKLHFLGEQLCDEVQGFYFSRPLPFEAVEALLTESRHSATA